MIFKIHYPIYEEDLIVSIGESYDKILQFIKDERYKIEPKFALEYFSSRRDMDEKADGELFYHDPGIGILCLSSWKNDWKSAKVLMHEVHHFVFHSMNEMRGMPNECEAQAYYFVEVFDQVRRAINSLLDKEKKERSIKKRSKPSNKNDNKKGRVRKVYKRKQRS